MADNRISLCLPKGDALAPTARFLEKVRFPVRDYHAKNRTYRPEVAGLPVRAKIMAEKDVALQVAVGNYDIGCCGLDWVREHAVKYRGSHLHVFRHLGLGHKGLYVCAGADSGIGSVGDLADVPGPGFVTIVSEYPNLAENFAIRNRLGRFRIFTAWGSVEGYPPEHADLVLLAAADPSGLPELGLQPLGLELASELCLVVNRNSLVTRDLSPVLAYFADKGGGFNAEG
jgi:ATP phosphoribosyltransferase